MAGTSTQPSRVNTADTPPDRPANIVTDELAAARDANPDAAPSDQDGRKPDDSATSDDKNRKSRRDRSAERKIAKLSKKLADAESATTADRQRIEQLEQQIAELREGKAPPAKPARKDFDNDEAYAEAYAEWKAKSSKKKPEAKAGQEKPGDERKPAPAKGEPAAGGGPTEEEISAFKAAGVKKYGDEFLEAYQDSDDVAVNQAMADFILDAGEHAPDLYLWLANHEEEARKLYFKSEYAVVRRLTKLQKLMEEAGTWDVELAPGKGKSDDDGKAGGKGADDTTTDETKGSRQRSRRSRAPDPPDQDDRGTPSHEVNLEDADMDTYAETRRRHIKKSGAPLL